MGGELKACGCYDGPFSPDKPTLVSVRCDEHLKDGPLGGYVLLRLDAQGRLYRTFTRRDLGRPPFPKMAVPKGRRR